MKRLIAVASALAVATGYFVLSALPAFSADTGTVNAKVTVASPCIAVQVAGGSIDFGTLTFSTPTTVVRPGNGNTTITNCATTNENISARGTDATGANATWTLVGTLFPYPCTHGTDKYGLDVEKVGPGAVALTTQDQLLGNAPPGQVQHPFNTTIFMPCTGSSGAGQTMNFQIVYTASL
jgi:hypothetical protein